MHPKSLKDMCIDMIVSATVNFQLHCYQLKELFNAVRKVWKELWCLKHVHMEAVSLLHARVFHTKQLSVSTLTHQGYMISILNIFPPIVTLLAAGTTELIFNPSMVFISNIPLACLAESGILIENNNLVVINTVTVHFGRGANFFVHLLPCCHRLTTLILECNVTPEVLRAARKCPLQTLGISNHFSTHSVTILEALTEVMLGIPHRDFKSVLNTYMRGEQVPLSPTWPNLINFNTGSTLVSLEFLTLVLVAHPNLQFLDSDVVSVIEIVKLYVTILKRSPSLPKLSLAAITTFPGVIQELYPYYPKLWQVTLVIHVGMEGTLMDLLQLGHHLPNITHLKLKYTSALYPLQLPKNDQFQAFTQQIAILEFDALPAGHLEAWWVMALLRQFPCLKRLSLNTNRIVYTESGNPWVGVFNTVTNLQCLCDNKNLFMSFLSMFPSLHKLTLTCFPETVTFPWEHLRELKELRHLCLFACKLNNILDLCKVPRETLDGSPWNLHVAVRHVPKWVAGKLQHAGWTWRPVSDIPLTNQY